MTPADLLARELRRDPARPLLTWYDDATGARVELSVATTANWAAKLANLLVDEHDLEPGGPVGVRLPAHWQTAVVLLGIWTAGAAAVVGGGGAVGFGTEADADADVQLRLDPMGADLARACAAQPDVYTPVDPVEPGAPALVLGERTWSHAELAERSLHAAERFGLDGDARVLSTLDYATADGLGCGLLAPLACGGSVVLVGNAVADRQAGRCAVERVTHTAGIGVDGTQRLD